MHRLMVTVLYSAAIICKACAFVRPILPNTCVLKDDVLMLLTDIPKDYDGKTDTIRVRIWRALASGDELSLTQLSKIAGERRLGEIRSHLTHVERQAKTIGNKSNEWRVRRGLDVVDDNAGRQKKLRIKKRKGNNNQLYIKLC